MEQLEQLFVYINTAFLCCMIIIEIVIIIFSKIELNKRKILIVLDFLGISFFYCIILFWFTIVFPYAVPPLVIIYMILYNLILFKVVKKAILRNRALRINEEITDHILDALRSLADLDYKNAYHILEDALSKHPNSVELKRLKTHFDAKIKDVTGSDEKDRDPDR